MVDRQAAKYCCIAKSICVALVWSGLAVGSEAAAEPVDVELVIATDVSYSMSFGEKYLQFAGFAAAFRDPEVIATIESGHHGKVAVAIMEWGGEGQQNVVVPWTAIHDRSSAAAFAEAIERHRPGKLSRGTAIGDALARASALLQSGPYTGTRRVVDVSGNGINNRGLPLAEVRARLVADGITINGLPITLMASSTAADDFAGTDGNLVTYFEQDVIGGPMAFVEPAPTIERFNEAVRRKLLRELGGDDRLAARAHDTGPTALPGARRVDDASTGPMLAWNVTFAPYAGPLTTRP